MDIYKARELQERIFKFEWGMGLFKRKTTHILDDHELYYGVHVRLSETDGIWFPDYWTDAVRHFRSIGVTRVAIYREGKEDLKQGLFLLLLIEID